MPQDTTGLMFGRFLNRNVGAEEETPLDFPTFCTEFEQKLLASTHMLDRHIELEEMTGDTHYHAHYSYRKMAVEDAANRVKELFGSVPDGASKAEVFKILRAPLDQLIPSAKTYLAGLNDSTDEIVKAGANATLGGYQFIYNKFLREELSK